MIPGENHHLLVPDWDAPASVGAVVTLRTGGVSASPYDSLNLGDHVGDDSAHVQANRERLAAWVGISPTNLQWLKQVHGVRVVEAAPRLGTMDADAVTTSQPGLGCIVMTADCLPVFFCDRQGTRVAVAHAGWRGLLSGVLDETIRSFANPAEVLAWLGPAIGPDSFEVGEEVRAAFVSAHPDHQYCFRDNPKNPGHWFADLYALARLVLHRQGVTQVSGGGLCTFQDSHRFFSYRREGTTGRMASLIWLHG